MAARLDVDLPIAHASGILLGAGGVQVGEGISLKKKLMEAACTATRGNVARRMEAMFSGNLDEN